MIEQISFAQTMSEQNTPLLNQLQQRLVAMLKTIHDVTDDDKLNIYQLIAYLFNFKETQNRFVSIAEIENSTAISITVLQQRFPELISDDSNTNAPIIVFESFIAFRRDYLQLQSIAEFIHRPIPVTELKAININWQLSGIELNAEQKNAALNATTQPFCIITGGAGTGKTTTLTKALELILLNHPKTKIMLATPTGKAAHRLNESLAQHIPSTDENVREQLARLKAITTHQLLGMDKTGNRAFHHAQNPLHCDVLAIDESSMLSTDLFVLIKNALLPHTHVILLGDANQLQAVNGIGFFSDLCQLQNKNMICELSTSNRFDENSIIQQASNALLNNDSAELINTLKPYLHELTADWQQQLISTYPNNATELQEALQNRMILCANRHGNYGYKILNGVLDQHFRKIIAGDNHFSPWYTGRKIIITKNDYRLNLNNGDIGTCQHINNQWMIVFDDNRQLTIEQLNHAVYELGFAISVHKSQGSEYEHVDIVLSEFDVNNPNPLITKSLLYTAITRAKKSLAIDGDVELIDYAMREEMVNHSPLMALLKK